MAVLGLDSAPVTPKPIVAASLAAAGAAPSIAMPVAGKLTPAAVQIAESPGVIKPVSSPNREGSFRKNNDALAAQDVSDRNIAHIITGGYARG
jgi:hypothetical protein